MKPVIPYTYSAINLRHRRHGLALACLVLAASLSACSKGDDDKVVRPVDIPEEPMQQQETGGYTGDAGGEYTSIEWTDLIPKDDLDALLSPPEYLDEIEDGSEADQIDSQTQSLAAADSDDRYQQALASKRVIAEYNNQRIRMPGFVVPLEFDDDMAITEFFLVPYFGACIHLPPPPPNQVVHVTYPKGLQAEALYDPFWVSGTLKTHVVENDVATAAYTLEAVAIAPYDEPMQ